MNTAISDQLKLLFDRRGLTLATAESVTVGYLQAAIAATSGASTFFNGGVTAYNIEQKGNLLGVDRLDARKVNAVSPKVAMEMAQGACKLFNVDIGVGITGYAEAYKERGISEPYAFFSIWHNNDNLSINNPVNFGKIQGEGESRIQRQKLYAKHVLKALLVYLESTED